MRKKSLYSNIIFLLLFSIWKKNISPCLDAWKESCGGIFSIWAERRDLKLEVDDGGGGEEGDNNDDQGPKKHPIQK